MSGSSQRKVKTRFSPPECQSPLRQAECTTPRKTALMTVWLTVLGSPTNTLPSHHYDHISPQCSFSSIPCLSPHLESFCSTPVFFTPTARKSRYKFQGAVIRNFCLYQLTQCLSYFPLKNRSEKQRKNQSHSLKYGAKKMLSLPLQGEKQWWCGKMWQKPIW